MARIREGKRKRPRVRVGAPDRALTANGGLAVIFTDIIPLWAIKEFLSGLTAIHDGLIPWQGYPPPPEYVVPKSEHPVVARHPETGRKLLFVNAGFTSHIVQLSRDESRAILDMLFNLVKSPILSCRVRWAPGTLVFWDNRCTQHHAVWDYFPHSRYGERVTINGTRPRA